MFFIFSEPSIWTHFSFSETLFVRAAGPIYWNYGYLPQTWEELSLLVRWSMGGVGYAGFLGYFERGKVFEKSNVSQFLSAQGGSGKRFSLANQMRWLGISDE